MPDTLPAIWPENLSIPVIGAAGEYQGGKTVFGLTIDPANTLCFDLEKSSPIYEGLGFTRIDVPDEMLKLHPGGYKPIDAFIWWRDILKTIEPGKYSVIMVDPISDIEAGLVDWVKANPDHFGRTANQYDRASGIMWADVKAYWKTMLVDLAARCQTFFFTAHMRQVWRGSSPTGRREPKGKDTLMELASLYLLLDRDPNQQGNVPKEPHAIILKTRLAKTSLIDGEPVIIPVLPPRLEVATPNAIRKYISNPPNYDKLKAKEKVPDQSLTEDEKLELKAETARNEADAESMKAGRFELMERAAKQQQAQKTAKSKVKTAEELSAAKPTESITEAARTQDAPETKGGVSPTILAPLPALSDGTLNPDLLNLIKQQVADLAMTPGQIKKACKKRNCEKLEDLTPEAAEELRGKLWNMLTMAGLEAGK